MLKLGHLLALMIAVAPGLSGCGTMFRTFKKSATMLRENS